MRFRFYFVLLLVGSMVGLAQAQNATNSLAGTIQDTSGAVIVGAQVTLATQDGKIVAQGVTDGSGNFRLPIVSAGSYMIHVTQTGFQEVKQQTKVASGE